MRITNNLIFKTIINNVNHISSQLLKAQTVVSTGKKINRFSDDPIGAGLLQVYKQKYHQLEQYQKNMQEGVNLLNITDTTLEAVENIIKRASELAIEGANDTLTAEDREKISYEVQSLYENLLQEANKRVGNRYIFAGYNYTQEPFLSDGTYQGTSDEFFVEIDEGQTIAINVTGDKVFKGIGLSGGIDIFQAFRDFKTALETNDVTGIRNAIDDMDKSLDQILKFRSEIGARVNRIQRMQENIDTQKYDIKTLISNIEDANLEETLSNLAQLQASYQAALVAAAKIGQSNMFNYL